jgi:small GTP-binding protein
MAVLSVAIVSRKMKVVILGGQNSGKTSLVARILNISYQKLIESMNGIPGVSIHSVSGFSFWDIPGMFLNVTRSVHDYIFHSTNGILLVIDSSSKDSCLETLQWIELMRNYLSEMIPVIVLANKADSMKYLTPQFLDEIVSKYFFSGWYWTVGHAQYGDYDFRRGRQSKQLAINEVITKLEKLMIQQNIEEKSLELFCDYFKPTFHTSIGHLEIIPSSVVDISPGIGLEPITGWEYYGGVMTREEAENYLRSSLPGTFLLRRSDVTFQLRVALVQPSHQQTDQMNFGHVLLKQFTNALPHTSQEQQRHEEENVINGKISIGKKDLKGIVFNDLSDALFRGLGLLPENGLRFTRVVSHEGAIYLPKVNSTMHEITQATSSQSIVEENCT